MQVKILASSSRGNAYILHHPGAAPLLLECGLRLKDLQQRLWDMGVNLFDLAGCLVSHEHGDHSRCAGELARAGVDVYLSAGTAEAINAAGHRFRKVRARERFHVEQWAVLPFETVHNAAESIGFLIAAAGEKMVYVTDTAYVPVRFKGLTLIMTECNYSSDLMTENIDLAPVAKLKILRNHFSLHQVKRFLQANDLARVREIHLLHLSSGNSDADRFKREIMELTGKPVYIAEEGM